MKDLLRDCYEILRKKGGLSRRHVLPDYIRMRASAISTPGLRILALGSSLSVLNREVGLHLYREIVIAQVYSFSFFGSNPLIIDCGSNVGMSVLYFKKLFPECRVLAVEPDPEAFRMLQRNVSDNRWQNVTLYNSAVAGTDGTIDLYVSSENPGDLGTSTIPQEHLPQRLVVPSICLSTLIGDKEVDFLKLDIEGSEMEVIEELERSGALRRVRRMVIEYHHHIAGRADCLSQMLSILERSGFGYQMKCLDLNFQEPGGFQVIWICAYNKVGQRLAS